MLKYRLANGECLTVTGVTRSPSTKARIMKNYIKLVCSVSLLFGAGSALACDYPSRVSIPNGTTATKEDMLEGQRGVKAFVANMEIYLECIVDEEKLARAALEELSPEDEQQREDMLNKKYNAAVDEMERLAAQFNVEVQAYRAKESS
jgi:hypothetical protein